MKKILVFLSLLPLTAVAGPLDGKPHDIRALSKRPDWIKEGIIDPKRPVLSCGGGTLSIFQEKSDRRTFRLFQGYFDMDYYKNRFDLFRTTEDLWVSTSATSKVGEYHEGIGFDWYVQSGWKKGRVTVDLKKNTVRYVQYYRDKGIGTEWKPTVDQTLECTRVEL